MLYMRAKDDLRASNDAFLMCSEDIMLHERNLNRLQQKGCNARDLEEVIREIEKRNAEWDGSGEAGQKVVSQVLPKGDLKSYGKPGYIGEIADAFVDFLIELIEEDA